MCVNVWYSIIENLDILALEIYIIPTVSVNLKKRLNLKLLWIDFKYNY